MPENRAVFDRAMEQFREAARQARWEEALKLAIRALQEFSQDTDARMSAAVALFHNSRFPESLHLFEQLRTADANNPLFPEYIARIQEQQGNIPAAADAQQVLTELYLRQRQPSKAIAALREVVRLRPELVEQRAYLARMLEEAGAARDAALEHLALARLFQEAGQLEQAVASAETVVRLDPASREGRELITSLRDALRMAQGGGMAPPTDTAFKTGVESQLKGMTGNLRAQQSVLDRLVNQAHELQQAGDNEGAIAAYEEAINSGFERADVLYSLGMLYQDRGDHKSAVPLLARASADTEYALSAHFALGSAYKELNQLPQAAQEFEQTIRLVDLESIGRAEVEDLIQMYESAASIYEKIDLARAALLYANLAEFLDKKRWGKERAVVFKQRSDSLKQRNILKQLSQVGTGALRPLPDATPEPEPRSTQWGMIRPITDFLRNGGSKVTTGELRLPPEPTMPAFPPEVAPSAVENQHTFAPLTKLDIETLDEQTMRWVQASEHYVDQGLIDAALDACHEVIKLNVEYLPIHLRMGEIFERQGRPDEALLKYQLLVDTFRVRDDAQHAIDVYYRLIDLSPDTVNARARLADLLKSVGRTDEAAEQLIFVAQASFRIGQTNKALEEYRRALQWAPKNREAHVSYGQMLLKLDRYESALGEFRRALELGSSDDPLAIARLNMTMALMNEQPAAIWDSLATLLDQLKNHPQATGVVQAEYRSALLNNETSILHYLLGIIQQQNNQHSSALLAFDQALMLLEQDQAEIPAQVLVHQAMADSHIALGQPEEALDQLRRGQAVADKVQVPAGIKHHFAVPLSRGELVRRMAEAYAASGDMAGAEKALLEARQLMPYDRAIYTKLADVYFGQGKLKEAIEQLDAMATYYEGRQDLDRAIEALETARRFAPSNITIGNRLAHLQIRRGYLDKGLDGLEEVANRQVRAGQIKDAVVNLQEAAQVYWTLQQLEKARNLYDRIIQIAPNDVEARQWLTLMYTLMGDNHKAIDEKKQIARIFAQQRDYDSAIAELHQIIGINPNDKEAYFMLGDMLMRRSEFAQAVQLYNRMLKIELFKGDTAETAQIEALFAAAKRMHDQQRTENQ